VKSLQQQLYKELTRNILPFWLTSARDKAYGGCFGEMDTYGKVNVTAEKSVILHARVLWSFSESYNKLQKKEYLQEAHQYYDFMTSNFIDKQYKGVFNQISYDGVCHQEDKSIIAQAYTVFAFSIYFQASGNYQALSYAKQMMHMIEAKAKNEITGQYYSDLTRNWESSLKKNYSVSASTYLHLIESYTALLKCEENNELFETLTQLVRFFINNIFDIQHHYVKQNISLQGNAQVTGERYGHDMEAAWLLVDAANVLNISSLSQQCESVSLLLIEQVIKEHQVSADAYLHGFSWGVNIEAEPASNLECCRVAWVQAEALNALSWAYTKTNKDHFKKWLLGTWYYIDHYLVDSKNKDWFESRNINGSLGESNVKIGPWKCPYHSVRGCVNFLTLLNNEEYNLAFSQEYANGLYINNKEAS